MNNTKNQVFWRWYAFGQCGWNYEKMQGLGYLFSIYPFIEEQYKDKDQLSAIAKTHSQFFNTNNAMAPAILAVDMALEENKGIEAKDAVVGIKTGLMGPLAGIGDTLFFVIPTTIIGSIASYMALNGNPIGLLLWPLFGLIRLVFMRFIFTQGYKEGVNLISSLTTSLNKVTRAANILGLTVIGALIPAVVKGKLSFVFSYGDATQKLQDVANQIMPGLIPLLIVLFTYWLLGLKYMNSTRVILILLVLGIVFYNLNILGI